MFQLPQSQPVWMAWALFAIKSAEFVALLRGGIDKARAHRRRFDRVRTAYKSGLKWLRELALFRPALMIFTATLLAVLSVWFILIIYSYYDPHAAISQRIASTYQASMWISLIVILFGLGVIFLTSFSFSGIYNIFRGILPQPQQKLASRIDREIDGYFHIDNDRAGDIVPYLIKNVLDDPKRYDRSEVYTPTPDEVRSAKYSNFLFFGEMIEAKATAGNFEDQWGWAKAVFCTTDLFEPTKMRQLSEKRQYSQKLVEELTKQSGRWEIFGTGFKEALDVNAERLGKYFEYDARNIGRLRLRDRLLIALRLRKAFELIRRRLDEFDVYKLRPPNTLVLIKLMAIRRIWNINWRDFEFPFSPWLSVFLLRSKILGTDLKEFGEDDQDFEWFRNETLRRISKLVEESLKSLNQDQQEKIKKILKSDINYDSAMILTDTFLWMVGSECCRYNNCRELRNDKGQLCPLGEFGICEPEEGKELFTYEQHNFVFK
jgi:hypothetical protein